MESTKVSALLLLAMLALSSSPVILACSSCGSTGSSATPSTGVTLPTLPPAGLGAVAPVVGSIAPVVGSTVPPVLGSVPPVLGGSLPPVLGGSGSGSPITLPKLPIIGGSGSPASPKVRHGGRKACPPSPPTPTPSPPTPTPSPPTPTPSYDTCPIDGLKLGVCLDILGNEVHIGDASVKCCPLVQGVAGLTVAACLCTAIKAKVLDISLYVPLALKVLVNDCGCAIPPGYTCA